MNDERTCETCEFSEMYWAPKGATTRRICKRTGSSVAFERASNDGFKVYEGRRLCGPLAIFWKKKEWV